MTYRVEHPRAAELAAARRAIDEHPGSAAHRRWTGFKRTIELHHRNLAELTELLAKPSADPMFATELTQNVRPPVVRDEFTAQLDQRIHNAIASAVSLVDQAREVMKKYADTDFAAEFERRNDAIKDDDRGVFVANLRNYLLHRYGNLPLNFQSRFSATEGFSASVRLPSAAVIAWDGWRAGARRYLNEHEWVDLDAVFDWYREASADLHRWLLEAMHELHSAERDEINELIAQYNEILTGSRTPRANGGQSGPG